MTTALVVDDERIVTRDLEEGLAQLGYEVVGTASSGVEAISKAKELHPDVILMDIMMPGEKNGITAAEEIKAEMDIPVVFLTAYADMDILEQAKGATPFGYIVKPFQAPQLRASIEMALHKAWLQKQLMESGERLQATVKQLEVEVSDRKRAEEDLQQAHKELQTTYDNLEQVEASVMAAEKLAALGLLTAGVSHEILNPLNIILMGLDLMLGDLDIPPEVSDRLRVLKGQADRIDKITKNLIAFARSQPHQFSQIDLNEMLQNTIDLLEQSLQVQNITVELRLAEGLPPVSADKDQLQQVVLNLLTNAQDAMPEGGRLFLSTGTVQVGRKRLVEFEVEDTGSGIAPEAINKIFDPFFTTKGEGEGTGLGLSICQGIIKAHGGVIWAESEPGQGATFIIHLPLEQTEERNAE
jgi:signal transduction histidine kinase